jgi:hypothetical protein
MPVYIFSYSNYGKNIPPKNIFFDLPGGDADRHYQWRA